VTFTPDSIRLQEGGEQTPDDWFMTTTLTWTGTFRAKTGRLQVVASEAAPFETDLASVPRPLTWLIPRYGRYTKAAVVHDYYCRHFAEEAVVVLPRQGTPGEPPPDQEVDAIELEDRSDADELFRLAMTELKVPWISRWLMWTAVTWATLLTSLRTGRSSKGGLRWIGRGLLLAAGIAVLIVVVLGAPRVVLDASFGWAWLRVVVLVLVVWAALATSVLVAGYVAQGRWDRWLVYLAALAFTIVALPLLLPAAIAAFFLGLYLLLEDFPLFKNLRRRIGRLFGRRERAPATPHQERLEAVRAS
jgi:Protein of unknown function (DUF1353)